MKQIVLAIVAVALISATPARAEQWSKTYNISGRPDLRVDTSDANIRVETWDQKTIEAVVISTRYKIGQGGLQIEEHQNGDMVEINVRFPHGIVMFGLGNHRVDINVHMPREGKVDLHTGDGKIDIASFKGEMNLRSGDGAQNIQGVDGNLHATTGDGHISLGIPVTVEGTFSNSQIHGKMNGGGQPLTIHTGDGSIRLSKS